MLTVVERSEHPEAMIAVFGVSIVELLQKLQLSYAGLVPRIIRMSNDVMLTIHFILTSAHDF